MRKMNGLLFKQMLESGANNLANKYAEVDSLNVFPVPDGDTGTNMSLTFTAGVNDALKVNSTKIGDIAKALSKGLLMGARGNSGVWSNEILASSTSFSNTSMHVKSFLSAAYNNV